ncbi:MAG TPA: type II secretion system protein M [Psychromonas hadalis]|nr:type II secretion system protein M [Psychromonas hadalis]
MVEKFQEWWESISEREQIMAGASAVVMAIGILYWGIYSPLNNAYEANKLKSDPAEKTLSWVQASATTLVKAGATTQKSKPKNKNLSQVLNHTSKNYNIKFKRIVNKKGKVDVWVEDVDFSKFIKWLTLLEKRYSVEVLDIDMVRKETKGYVQINRLSLGYAK